ncbi:MAG: Lrp/AsnC family transcriptional regulator [Kiloniellales bacterium]|nr:Lrp/AsnC family transcriptional regulator [Kiloniellales bacterium]
MAHTVRLDQIDLRILTCLQRHARITNHKLAEEIGLSPSPCLQRVRKLEASGLIGPYLATVNLDGICRNVMVLATITLRTHEHDDFRAFEAIIAELPEVVECFKVSGTFDYFLRFVCPDLARYHALTEGLLSDGPGIAQISSHVVLDRTKEFRGYDLERLV